MKALIIYDDQPHSLPTWLEEWLRCWVMRRNVENAALAVLSNEGAGVLVAPDARYLSQFAERNGLSLIAENEITPEDQTLSAPRARSAGFCYRAANI